MESLIHGVGFVFVYVVLAIIAAVVFYLVVRFLMLTITVGVALVAVNLIPSLELISSPSLLVFFVVLITVSAFVIAFIFDMMSWSERAEDIFNKGNL